jgi:3-oxoacyl-[acyl-carrier-protein] synthase-3
MSRNAVIIGTGSFAPETVIPNEVYYKKFEHLQIPNRKGGFITGREYLGKVAKAVGVEERRKNLDPNETTATMCVKAAKKALANAGLKPEDLDMIILSTDSPDFISPPTSSRIQFELGATNASFFDMNAACAGFTMALTTGWNFIKGQKELNHIMVIGGYGMSRYSDPEDAMTELLFADGAGAVILKGVDDSKNGIHSATFKGDGKYWDHMGIYAGGTWKGFSPETLAAKLNCVKFLKEFPADVNIAAWPELINTTMGKAGWKKDDINHVFFTQVNLAMILKVCEIMGWPPEISYNIMDKYGYTGSACVPMAMDLANQKGLLKTGDKIILCTSGGGAAFATLAMTWGK